MMKRLCILLLLAGCAQQAAPERRLPDLPIAQALIDPTDVLARANEIGLDAASRRALEADLRATQRAFDELDARLVRQREALSALIATPHVDELAASAAAREVVDTEGELKLLHLGLYLRTQNRLSATQQAQLRR